MSYFPLLHVPRQLNNTVFLQIIFNQMDIFLYKKIIENKIVHTQYQNLILDRMQCICSFTLRETIGRGGVRGLVEERGWGQGETETEKLHLIRLGRLLVGVGWLCCKCEGKLVAHT